MLFLSNDVFGVKSVSRCNSELYILSLMWLLLPILPFWGQVESCNKKGVFLATLREQQLLFIPFYCMFYSGQNIEAIYLSIKAVKWVTLGCNIKQR